MPRPSARGGTGAKRDGTKRHRTKRHRTKRGGHGLPRRLARPGRRCHLSGMSKTPSQPVCTICGKPQVKEFKPFCSRRCADIDLHRWMSGVYAIPATEDDDDRSSDSGAAGGRE